MHLIEHYGLLSFILTGEGFIRTNRNVNIHVDFEIAKRIDGTLLFGAFVKKQDKSVFDVFMGNEKVLIEGESDKGRRVKCENLSLKNLDGQVISGYAGQCEIGEKIFSENTEINFSLNNFLYHGNQTKVEKTQKGKRYTSPYLDLDFDDFKCRIEQTEHYGTVKKILKRQGGISHTSTLRISGLHKNRFSHILGKVKKLNQLLSVARSTHIDWNHYMINTDGKVVYELYANKIKRDYHENPLLRDVHPKETIEFLNRAWVEYDKCKKEFDLERLLYGYIDSFEEVFIESRCLLKAVLVDFLATKLAVHENKEYFLDNKVFELGKNDLREEFEKTLGNHFRGLKPYQVNSMVTKLDGLNNRPLKMKLDRLISKFSIPIEQNETKRFIKIRNSLAHSSLFPVDEKSIPAYLFMGHFLDRIILCVFGYSGRYFDIENRKEKTLISNSA